MSILQILFLAVVQGLAELLPVSSSAHVIFTEKLMGLDPSAPELTFLLVMLHTGTMFAAIIYFRQRWIDRLKKISFRDLLVFLIASTAVTGVVGLSLKIVIEKIVGEVENLFSKTPLVAGALAVAGVLIILSSKLNKKENTFGGLNMKSSLWIGLVQGLCLPFRGLSRSGVTISTALMNGVEKNLAEEFSFALAVVLTPAVVVLEVHRLMKHHETAVMKEHFTAGIIGMIAAFVAGLVALRILHKVLESNRWNFFGYYCLAFAALMLVMF